MGYNYKNEIGEVPVGKLYESVTTSGGKEVTVNKTNRKLGRNRFES